ncbi:hypothetical protein LAJ19_06340 [Deinococcus taeanensis]|uniref:hypothetical protein n=1 Tax=Deinococcus taeanensis TaxID=2737050 RepID=UPI001CDCA107|nr:hypothetical protein [Deinococcus taeanensis]UBV43829.1 hypothetical protein LAJ19_06340 [Deinococcus taeanensis]
MLIGLLVLILMCVNVGGLISVALQFGRGEWPGALSSLVTLVLLDALGFRLLRGLREQR